MRIRHGPKARRKNDFDLSTQDSFLKLWTGSARGRIRAHRDLLDRPDGGASA